MRLLLPGLPSTDKMSGVLVPLDLGVSQGLPALLPRTRWLLYSLAADAGLQQHSSSHAQHTFQQNTNCQRLSAHEVYAASEGQPSPSRIACCADANADRVDARCIYRYTYRFIHSTTANRRHTSLPHGNLLPPPVAPAVDWAGHPSRAC